MDRDEQHYRGSAQDDELAFRDIWLALKSNGLVIGAFTFLFAISSLVLAYLIPDTYKCEVKILPPLQSDIDRMNIIPENFYRLRLDMVYKSAVTNLGSTSLRKLFFQQNGLDEVLRSAEDAQVPAPLIFQERFNKLFTIEESEEQGGELPSVSIFLEGKDPQKTALWLNKFVEFAETFTTKSMVKILQTNLVTKLEDIQEKIVLLMNSAEQKRLDEIAKLEEALEIAEELNLQDQAEIQFNSYSQVIQNTQRKAVVVNDIRTPDYLRGSRILSAELDALKKRKKDEHFVQGLRELQEEQQYYNSFLARLVYGRSLRIDQEANVPTKPYKPRRMLMVMGGFFTGLFFGVFFVLFRLILAPVSNKISR